MGPTTAIRLQAQPDIDEHPVRLSGVAEDDEEVALDFMPPSGGGNDDGGDDDDDVAAIYARHHEDILRFFRTKVPSNAVADAEELTAVVFTRLIERRRRGPLVDKQGRRFSIKGFLYGTAMNVLKEHLRKVIKHNKLDDIGQMSIAAIGRSLSSQIAHGQKLALVHQGLRCLPFYEQLVIECCSYHQMSFKDVAALLKVPMGSVATYNHRGRMHLAEWMKAREKARPSTSVGDDERPSRYELAAYPWYDPETGRLDFAELVACVMRNKRKPSAAEIPAWFLALELPHELSNASVDELWNLVYSVWKAWVAVESSSC